MTAPDRPWRTIFGHLEKAEALLDSARRDSGLGVEAAVACGVLANAHVALATFYATLGDIEVER